MPESEWTIKSISNETICTVKSVERHGQLMNGRWLTVDIDSPVKLVLSAGCYLDFDGIRYSIRSFADVEKSARPQSHGGAFTYKGLRLDDVTWQELEDTQMCDYVYGDNHLHYSGLGTFSFFASKASDVGYRVLANLRNKYGNSWNVLINGEDITDNYEDYTFDEAKSISISSGTNVKEALDLLWSNWGVYYKVSYRTIDIITSDREPGIELKYGKNNGLKSIRRKINPNVEICTRVRAYGSERNMPYKWYNNKYPSVFGNAMYVPQLMLPHYAYVQNGEFIDANGNLYTNGGQVNLWANPSDIVLPSKSDILTKYGSRDKEIHWNSDDMGEIFPSMKGMTASEVGVYSDVWDEEDERLDKLLGTAVNEDGTAITGTGDTSELTTGKINFVVRVPNPGFDPMEQKGQEDVVLLMQSGMCQSRGFVILKSEAVLDGNEQTVAYDLTCVKTVDDEIDQVFPNGNYTINGGEEYVYTGLTFNDESSLTSSWLAVYISAAEKRLLRAAALWLREHQTEQYVYEVTPDNIYLQKQKDEDSDFEITEGDFITLSQDDLGHSEEVVETVVVRYGKEAIPTYEITFLRRDESESLGDRVKGLVGQSISASSEIAKANDNLAKKVNKTGFHTLFDPLDAQYNVLDINGDLSNLKYIRANVDFFSIKGVAALGTTSGGGGGGGGGADLNALLDSINDSDIGNTMPTAAGQVITWNGSKWIFDVPSGGGGGTDLLSVWKSLTNNSSLSSYDNNTKIAEAHIPDLSSTYVTWSNVNRTSYSSWNKIPFVNAGGAMDIGKTLEFHSTNGGSTDYNAVLMLDSNKTYTNVALNLPNTSGTLALTSQIPTSMAWSAITSKPDTIQGYGISDAYISTINGVTSVTLGDKTFTPVVTYNNSATLTSPYYVVTSGSLSGNTLTLGRRTLASILNASGYTWWGRAMTTGGVVKGGIDNASYIEFTENTGASHGGYIDFHYAGNTSSDYTSRIIEDDNGRISVNSAYFNSNGNVGFGTTPHNDFRVNVSGNIRTNGDIFADNNFAIRVKASSGASYYNILNLTNDNPSILDVGWGSATQALCTTRIWGNATHFMNSSGTETVYLSNNGQLYVTQGTQGVRIGNALLSWEQGSNSLKVTLWDGSPCNFYSLGGISALGATSGSGGLTELTLGKLKISGTGNSGGVLFQDSDGDCRIYSSDGSLYIKSDSDVTIDAELSLNDYNITNVSTIYASLIEAGTASIYSNYVYINRQCRIYANGSTVYLQTRPNTTTTTWTTKETWS